jgi:hypothetical protein
MRSRSTGYGSAVDQPMWLAGGWITQKQRLEKEEGAWMIRMIPSNRTERK